MTKTNIGIDIGNIFINILICIAATEPKLIFPNFRAKLVHMVKHAHFVIIKRKKKFGLGNAEDFLIEIDFLSKLSKIQLIII